MHWVLCASSFCACRALSWQGKPDACKYLTIRLFAVSTFPLVFERRVHRVYSDTADSSVTPSNSHAPCFLQSRSSHVLITHFIRSHWTASATPLFLIGNMLPPASLLWILFLFFFSPSHRLIHSAEASLRYWQQQYLNVLRTHLISRLASVCFFLNHTSIWLLHRKLIHSSLFG